MRIDFHSNMPDKLHYGCRLVRKARAQAQDKRLLLLCDNPQQLARVDDMLWTFSDLDFLPHVAWQSALRAQTPILLCAAVPEDVPPGLILINLSWQVLAPEVQQKAQFARMFDLVSTHEQDRQEGRARYRFYQQQGHELSHLNVGNAQ